MRPNAFWLLAAALACAPPLQQPPDAGEDAGDAGDAPLRPVAPFAEPAPVALSEWMVAGPLVVSDPYEAQLERGEFTDYPAAGADAFGVVWSRVEPGPEGKIAGRGAGIVYAAARVRLAEGQRLFARTEPTSAVWSNGVEAPGDFYHSRRHKVPLEQAAGDNLVVARILGGRGDPNLELWTTTDELVFNFDDLTFPDPVEGEGWEAWLGVPVLNVSGKVVEGLIASVLESDAFVATQVELPALARGAVTQVAFRLKPKAPFGAAGGEVAVQLRLESESLEWSYQRETKLKIKAKGEPYRRTRLSAVDGSVQYYGVNPPKEFDAAKKYALVLSLHGAGVDAIGQAQAYASKDWTYIVAPTNRRGFGFDWEEWGRLDGTEALDHAMSVFNIDPTRVYVTGHSMGGHGTWQFGVHRTGRFATVAPSAGWSSFYTYVGDAKPTGPFGRARASSDTNTYATNLARRGVYIIHGSADDNVPVREGRDMYALVKQITGDTVYHEEPGAGHWWDYPETPGADCVDWPPLFEFMKTRTLDPFELQFGFRTPSPWVASRHSYVTVQSVTTPYNDAVVTSTAAGDTVTVTTTNVRGMELDGAALRAKGISKAVVNGEERSVPEGVLAVGPQEGKSKDRQGPFNQVFHRPFCLAWKDDAPPVYERFAAYLTSYWNIYGNGQACGLPLSRVTAELRASHNIVYLGVPSAAIPGATPPLSWDSAGITAGANTYTGAALAIVFSTGDRLAGALFATAGQERLVRAMVPFSSRAGIPDWLVWNDAGGVATGFFDAQWGYSAALSAP
jgi:poly(3-hydroxybutyrate) depolymerase